MRGRCASHVDHAAGIVTCPGCIRRARRDLAAIEDLHALMLPEAIEAGIDSEAANLAGPAASSEQVEGKRGYEDARRGWCAYPRDAEDLHPYTVLGWWDLALRESYGPQSDLFITVNRARSFLDGLLAGMFPHTREFEEFSKHIARCRNHLEAVLHDSRTPEQGRPCPRCAEAGDGAPRLQKRYAQHAGAKGYTSCPDPEKCLTCQGANDTWHCPHVGEHWWTEHDYRDRVAVDYIEHATELPVRELAERCGVPAGTIRRWAAATHRIVGDDVVEVPPLLRSRGRYSDGRKTYRVTDVERLRDRIEA
jgi:hypothetical protein